MGRSSRATEALTALAYAALTASFASDPLPQLLGALQSLVGADVTGFHTHEWDGWTTTVQLYPEAASRLPHFPRLPTELVVGLHPGVAHLVRARPTLPFAVTDIVPEREWTGSALFAAMRADWGRNHQFALPVPPRPGTAVSEVFVLGRMVSRFTPADREVADALLPVLSAVARHRAVVAELTPGDELIEALTAREIAVLGLLADGLPAREVALRLGMAMRTAQKHLEHVYRKLDVHSGADAVRVYRSGLDPVPAASARPREAAEGSDVAQSEPRRRRDRAWSQPRTSGPLVAGSRPVRLTGPDPRHGSAPP